MNQDRHTQFRIISGWLAEVTLIAWLALKALCGIAWLIEWLCCNAPRIPMMTVCGLSFAVISMAALMMGRTGR